MANETETIHNKVNAINEEAEKLKEIANGANVALTEMRLQFETMMEMQKQERLERERMYNEEKAGMRKHYGRIIIGLIVTLCLILGAIIGGAIYLFTNQDVYSDNNGTATIYDGIHFDTAS